MCSFRFTNKTNEWTNKTDILITITDILITISTIIISTNRKKTMEKDSDPPKNEVVPTSSTTWESQCLMINVYKTLDSRLPSMKVDVASTLGTSNNLPLALKKAVRYWFGTDIKSKNDVVRYVNEICRQNGFKISTLSNSRQGLDRRAQLVCSRGVIARKPRGKSHAVQTTTTRPTSLMEKCPFSLTVYECRQSSRWYIRKYGNGNKMHCGHCQLLPEQVGIRRFQNLTERVGEDWHDRIGNNTDERNKIDNSGGRSPMTDDKSPKENPSTTSNTEKNPDPPTLAKPRMRLGLGLCADSAVAQNQDRNQILDYIDGLRDRIAYRNYSDQLLLERALRFQGFEAEMNGYGWPGSNTFQQHQYLGASSDIDSEIRNSSRRLLLDRIRTLSQSNSTTIDGGLLEYLVGNKYINGQISNYIDQSMLSNHVGVRELSSLTERNGFERRGENGVRDEVSTMDTRNLPSMLDLAGERAETDFRNINTKGRNAISHIQDQHRFSNLSDTEGKHFGVRNNDDRKRKPNDDDFCRLSQSMNTHREVALNNAKIGIDNMIPIHGENRRCSESLLENGKIGSCATGFDKGQNGSVRSKLVDNQVSKSKSIVYDRAMSENAGSNARMGSGTGEREAYLEDRIKTRKEISGESDFPQKSTAVADCIGYNSCAKSTTQTLKEREKKTVDQSSVLGHVSNGIDDYANENTITGPSFADEYAMLRPMAVYDYHSNSQPELVASGDQINPDDTGREETTELTSRSLKQGFYVDSSLAEETERFRHKRQKIDANR
jgi:hypothetical protein